MVWTQYTVDTVRSEIVVYVVGTLSLVQKGQISGFSGSSHTVDTVHSGRSGCSTQ